MDYRTLMWLFDINKIPYRVSKIYDENNQAFLAIWLDTGHFEFDENGMLSSIVDY